MLRDPRSRHLLPLGVEHRQVGALRPASQTVQQIRRAAGLKQQQLLVHVQVEVAGHRLPQPSPRLVQAVRHLMVTCGDVQVGHDQSSSGGRNPQVSKVHGSVLGFADSQVLYEPDA